MGEENSEVSSKSSLTIKNKCKQGFLYSGHFTDKGIGPMYSNNMRQGDNFDSLGDPGNQCFVIDSMISCQVPCHF